MLAPNSWCGREMNRFICSDFWKFQRFNDFDMSIRTHTHVFSSLCFAQRRSSLYAPTRIAVWKKKRELCAFVCVCACGKWCSYATSSKASTLQSQFCCCGAKNGGMEPVVVRQLMFSNRCWNDIMTMLLLDALLLMQIHLTVICSAIYWDTYPSVRQKYPKVRESPQVPSVILR